MVAGSLLLIVLAVAAATALAARSSRGPAPLRRTDVPPAAPEGSWRDGRESSASRVADDLARWQALGLLSPEQVAAILAHEARAASVSPPAAELQGPARSTRIPVIAEALAYLGGVLAIVGLVLVVARSWPDMPVPGRLGLSASGAVLLLAAGAAVHASADPAFGRMRGMLWLASAAATALFVGVLTAEGLDTDAADTIALTCGGAVAVQSGLLWWWKAERPLQQLAFLAALAVFTGATIAHIAPLGAVGIAVWFLGAAGLVAGLRRRIPLALLTVGVSSVEMLVGAAIATNWQGFGLIFFVATGFALLAAALIGEFAPTDADRLLVGVLGGLALVAAVPSTLGYFARDAGAATGLTVWGIGGGLLALGSQRVLRLTQGVEAVGAAGLLGGAALIGVQWPGFAPMFGLATSVGLLALGMLPGQVLLSAFGSLGLLANVPWAIGWFFPGHGRAPLLIMVSGVLILGIALLLTRLGGRFRREFAGPRHPRYGAGPMHHHA
jgi:hypothetical protein